MAINNAIRLLGVGLLAGLAVPALSAQGATDQTSGGRQDSLRSAAVGLPATLAENPPRAPKVTCDGDQLTISANNATLGSVLAAVHACIGVQIDIPSGAGGGRTFEELGPGPERQVLEMLLSGTDFNYVIGSSDADPGKVETVLLMERAKETAANAPPSDRSLNPGRRAWLESRQNLRRAGTTGEDATPPATDSSSDSPAPEEAVAAPADESPASATAAPAAATDTPAPAAAAEPPAPPAQAPPEGSILAPSASLEASPISAGGNPALDSGKSTSERIADMQQMFQQRRQMTQNQSPTSAQPQSQP